jgi:hypothetical protein
MSSPSSWSATAAQTTILDPPAGSLPTPSAITLLRAAASFLDLTLGPTKGMAEWTHFSSSPLPFLPPPKPTSCQKLYCENLGLVCKLNYFFTYQLTPIKCMLHSKYDVLAQSFLLLQAYLVTPELLHVKGHQDNKTPYANLPLPAQLNCDADKL